MLTVHIQNIGDMAFIECQGRIVRSEAAFELRKAVLSQGNARTIVLDLTEVHAIEGGGLGMLAVLQKWAFNQGIQLKLFNPTFAVKNTLEHNEWMHFDLASFEEVMALMARAENQYPKADFGFLPGTKA